MTDYHKAIKTLVTCEHKKLVRMALELLGDLHLAEDVVQQTLVTVLERKDRNGSIHNLPAYVYKAVRYNALRKRVQRQREIIGLPINDATRLNKDPTDMTPELLEEALLELPHRQQIIIRMRFYLSMSYREIGSALSISLNTAASACRYGLKKLRKQISTKLERNDDE